jgi:hypothetical protein
MDIDALISQWLTSLENPEESQHVLKESLLTAYQKTVYGAEKSSLDEFPCVTYRELKPHLTEVENGKIVALLSEPPVFWAMTRGTTASSKFIPITQTDLEEKMRCGPRVFCAYLLRTMRVDILEGAVLNLNFPSVLGEMKDGKKYGYSSGLYFDAHTKKYGITVVPEQKKIDPLTGLSAEAWRARFDLAYREACTENVTMVTGVTQVMKQFAVYLKKTYGSYPKDLWDIAVLVCSSAAGINGKLMPMLKALYGDVDILEVYGATEGIYAQQYDRPCLTPNYDTYYFEVEVKNKIKMLHQMKKGERGTLIVSSSLFPRYRIGDLLTCNGGNYFTVIGRDKRFTVLRHYIDRLLY